MTTDNINFCCDLAWFMGAFFALCGVVVGAVAVIVIEYAGRRRSWTPRAGTGADHDQPPPPP